MTKERIHRLFHFVFALFLIILVIMVFTIDLGINWQNHLGVVTIVFMIIVVSFVLYLKRNLFFRSTSNNYSTYNDEISIDSINEKSSKKQMSESQIEIKNDFNTILRIIDREFKPEAVNKEETEKQLIKFLNKKFPKKTQRHGHTSDGKKVGIVIDGTYSLELVVLNNESKLLSIVDNIITSRRDFSEVAVILIDIGKISNIKIKEYIEEFKELGAKIIIKKIEVDE